MFAPDSPFAAADEPRDAFAGRCSCGEPGCGALVVRITRSGNTVVWDRFRSGADGDREGYPIDAEALVFSAKEYDDVAGGRQLESEWEPTTRRAAILAHAMAREADLERFRSRSAGFDHRGDHELVVVALLEITANGDELRHVQAKALTPLELQMIERSRLETLEPAQVIDAARQTLDDHHPGD